jgi:hypothetical protein
VDLVQVEVQEAPIPVEMRLVLAQMAELVDQEGQEGQLAVVPMERQVRFIRMAVLLQLSRILASTWQAKLLYL